MASQENFPEYPRTVACIVAWLQTGVLLFVLALFVATAYDNDPTALAQQRNPNDPQTWEYYRSGAPPPGPPPTQQNTVPLKLYGSAQRQDNFTTATQVGEQSAFAAGYQFVRIEGYVFSHP